MRPSSVLIEWTIGWLIGLVVLFHAPWTSVYQALLITGAVILPVLLLSAALPQGWRSLVRWSAFGAGAAVLWGAVWFTWHAPPESRWLLKPVQVEGTVIELPARFEEPDRVRFLFHIRRIRDEETGRWQAQTLQVRLMAYGALARQAWTPGSRWQLTVRLRPVHGWLNPGGFDYEAWAFAQGIQAVGSVRRHPPPRRLGEGDHWQQWRAALYERLTPLWQSSPWRGLYEALTLGVRDHITADQWLTLQQTGTAHLMAISGLHLGAMATIGWLLAAGVWRWVPPIQQRMARAHFGWLGAVGLASVYLLLSGAGIPAQRAWIMVLVLAVAWWLRRALHPWAALALAALLVTLWHPPGVLSAGFWLSFTAVALILAVVIRLQRRASRWSTGWRLALIVQLVLLVGLMPLTLGYFDTAAGVAGLVNLIAVPFVMFVALPALAGLSLLHLLWPELAGWLWPGWETAWALFWRVLTAAQAMSLPLLPVLPLWLAAMMTLMILGLWLLPGRWRLGMVAGLTLLGVAWWHLPPSRPVPGSAWLTVLDVGQGQAIVIETARHVLVYDAGPYHGPRFNGGAAAILPYLRQAGWSRIDRLIVSHDDRDHAGGAGALLASGWVRTYLSGQPSRLPGSRRCEAGMHWVWDGVKFEILHPDEMVVIRRDNDASCVLKVTAAEGTVAALVAGDLPARWERWLVRRREMALRADLLIASHHGSRDANSMLWLKAVAPEHVAVSAGFANRFRHPAAAVRARWQRAGVEVHCTGCEGALRYRLGPSGVRMAPLFRLVRRTIYRHMCEGAERP